MKIMTRAGVAFTLILAGTAVSNAGTVTITKMALADPDAPAVTIYYSNADGTAPGQNSAGTSANPQVSSGTTSPLFYCIDLWHDNQYGVTYGLTPGSVDLTATSGYGSAAQIQNALGYLLTLDQTTMIERSALQLAIWDVVDSKGDFSYTYTGGDSMVGSALSSQYSADLASLTTADLNKSYGDTIYIADPGTNNQNMAIAGSSVDGQAVPEPSGFILGTIGTLCFAGLYWWRRSA
jgi:hypothetical protein